MSTIALITDFGSHDPYAASMKGVLASLCRASVMDLTHSIKPFDIIEAAFFLKSVATSFSVTGGLRVIFVVVVDPGVGSERRILAASSGGRYFVGPDNGALSLVLDDEATVRSVNESSYFLPHLSATFHGRDRFAPLAAALARGNDLRRLGSPMNVQDLARLPYQAPSYEEGSARGSIVRIDHFGNAVTDVEWRRVEAYGRPFLRVADREIRRLVRTYQEGDSEPFLIVGSEGTLEISIRNDSAAARLGLERLAPVRLSFSR